MSLLIDTSALIAARNADDKNHKKAMALMAPALHGEYGKVFVSDYIFDEAVTLAYIRTGNKKFAHDIGMFTRAKPINFRFIEPVDFDRAWELYQQFNDKHLSFTDCTNIALMERLDIKTLFTFDGEFKGLVNITAT
ncbi:type II toxin-antitoxin system VapC family toxin [Candidatus Methanoperedens nitratireducens]|uniref:Putative PIN domain protein n=1 Tax=Candidatus Methanoperedens nitratireducens TaxID=1392998 RepID=A0A284VKK0_9EURY|nr:PIN domain-containing protein [Candidatus Methanoperedens nitroreducens]SNQ59727.1 putative PIN domain protein [Candidatus Methanoperedens nitroreducens]